MSPATVPLPRGRDPEAERTRRRREKIAIAVAAVLIVALTVLEANLASLGGTVGFTSNIVIFALINLNVILVVLLIFLVTRNIFKVILDRKRNLLGARLRSRLVLIFVLFSLVPTVVLFVASATITRTSLRTWVGGRVGVALTDALEIARKNLEREAQDMKGVAEKASAGLPPGAARQGAQRALDAARRQGGPRTFLLLVRGGAVEAVSGEAPPGFVPEILARLKGARFPDGGRGSVTLVGEAYAAAARRTRDGRVVVAAKALAPKEAARMRDIARASTDFHQVRLLNDPIRASHIGILLLITLLIIFSASWMGIYLARQIAVPVQVLAEGTEKVASGDLDVRLDYRSDDEFGSLVASFNRMTADLSGMKKNLEDANVSLAATYEELNRRTQFIETILTNISTGVIVIDRQGRIAMINKVAERLLQIRADKALGHPYKEVVLEEHYEVVRALSREVGEDPDRSVERQVDLVVGGKAISLRASVTTIRDGAGEFMGLVVAFDDLSQAMRLQKILAWREVARRIAHEIRNPLTPIQLSAERLQRKFAPSLGGDPAFPECIQTILSEVGSLKHLVDEFTRFARMPVPVFKEGRLDEELRPVLETFRASYPEIRWTFDAGEAPLPPARFDPFQMRRVLTNLLENAAGALEGKGSVAVSLRHVPESDMVCIRVADDGPGVPAGDRDRIFEPYFSRKAGGTGLGLAIVSAIVSDHRGTARVRDNEPRGAVFEMEFPLRPRGRGEA